MGGMELLEKVRQSTSARPGMVVHPIQIIILTGFGTLETAKKAIRLDANAGVEIERDLEAAHREQGAGHRISGRCIGALRHGLVHG